LVVGLTSVGSGSLMIVLLMFVYPALSANRLVGTDLTQAVPLTAAAALGALAFGSVQFGVTTSIIIGSVPAVLVGSFLSSRAPDKYIRPVIGFVIFASGLKYAGVGTTALGWILCVVLLGSAIGWLAWARPWENAQPTVATIMHGSAMGNGRASANGSANGAARSDGSHPDGSHPDGSHPDGSHPDRPGVLGGAADLHTGPHPDGHSPPDGAQLEGAQPEGRQPDRQPGKQPGRLPKE